MSIPLSLYVHIPWCIRKCPYCDFNSHEKTSAFDEQRYVQALNADLDREADLRPETALTSIFFGGGTPSLFSASAIGRILEHINQRFQISADTEITLEANPGTFEQDKFSGFHAAGVNRLSIGIQSFNDQQLQALGRVHDSRQAKAAVNMAHKAGFDNINLDLMFGLPGQTIEQALDDISLACHFETAHLSHYQLTIEPNTLFHKHRPMLPDSDLTWEMQSQCQHVLADHGLSQYEVSAYSRPGQMSAHNLNYWRFGDYIGIGAGAHGKYSEWQKSDRELCIHRRQKQRQPEKYMRSVTDGTEVSAEQPILETDRCFEFLLNALRLKTGCPTALFKARTGLSVEMLLDYTREIDPQLLSINDEIITTTDRGYLFLNTILEQLL
jgi:putative oxygen-independent coproporphyrinogen III oxidase